ncbi:hypothetical protein [Vibrio coralliilyticus]|uniref:Uncharacterized protein n=1 Tax=Vibrio coralliilyticus TaxID=190893 RepID=A0AAP6ZLQ3_9VIBR|nr:hypothetical protein [Vibrio coralliilyticus]NOJ24301.1 hypothetical protein [Vibrio coralliilyticus]
MAGYNVVVAELAEREVMLMTQVVIAQGEHGRRSMAGYNVVVAELAEREVMLMTQVVRCQWID